MPVRFTLKSRLLVASAFAAVSGAAAAGAAPALAQDAESQVEDIIVTAQLREQSASEVPFALTAYTGEFLKDLGVQELDALSAYTPGLVIQNQSPNNPGFVIRGITSDSGAATQEPRVSVFQDGVSISKSRGSYVELFDIDRVEVAKGPQSTLYGRGALIGAINIVQTRAQPGETEAYAQIEAGNYGYRAVEGALNLPVGEDAAIRIASRSKSRDGYVENLMGGEDYNGIETHAFRLSGAWTPSDALRVDVIGNYQQDEGTGTSFKSIAYDPADPVTGAVLGTREPWTGAALTEGAAFDGGKTLGLDREVWGVTGLVRWDLSDSLTLNSTTAYRQFDNYETFDPDGVSLPILTAAEDTHGEQWSQEFRLGFDNGGAITAFVGAGWFQEEGYQRTPTQYDERIALAQLAGSSPVTGSLLDGLPGVVGANTLPSAAYPTVAGLVLQGLGVPAPFVPGVVGNLKSAHIETATNASELTSYDLFGDVTWRVTDRLEIAGGVRWTQDDKTTGYQSELNNGRSVLAAVQILPSIPPALQLAYLTALATPGVVNAPASPLLPPLGLISQPTTNNGDWDYFDSEDDGLTWRLTARYELTDDTNLYANYARGRRPETVGASGPATPLGESRFEVVPAETVDSFEIGAKTAMMDGRLRMDGAVFYYGYENFQTTVQDGLNFITVNAGEATAYGYEGSVFFEPTDSLMLFSTYGYNHGRFDAGAREGNRFRLSPDHKASFGAIWSLPVADGELQIQPTYTWQSKVFFDDDNDRSSLQTGNIVPDAIVDEYQDAYGLLSLRIRYEPAGAHWGVEAFGDNLLDEEYIKDAGNTGDALGMPTFIAGRPATYGVSFRLRY